MPKLLKNMDWQESSDVFTYVTQISFEAVLQFCLRCLLTAFYSNCFATAPEASGKGMMGEGNSFFGGGGQVGGGGGQEAHGPKRFCIYICVRNGKWFVYVVNWLKNIPRRLNIYLCII